MSEEKSVKKIDYSKNPVVLSASHVSKCFKLPTEQATGLKQAFINWTRGIKGYKKQQVPLLFPANWFHSSNWAWDSILNLPAERTCI